MEKIKQILSAVPVTVWVILALIIVIGFWWMSDDIGSWWESRKQAEFDAKQAEYEQTIEVLKQQQLEFIKRAEIAEAREQTRIVEKDLLLAEIARRGINIKDAESKIETAAEEFAKDQDYINKVATGEISKLEGCFRQCDESAALGYACIPSKQQYCDKFKE